MQKTYVYNYVYIYRERERMNRTYFGVVIGNPRVRELAAPPLTKPVATREAVEALQSRMADLEDCIGLLRVPYHGLPTPSLWWVLISKPNLT